MTSWVVSKGHHVAIWTQSDSLRDQQALFRRSHQPRQLLVGMWLTSCGDFLVPMRCSIRAYPLPVVKCEPAHEIGCLTVAAGVAAQTIDDGMEFRGYALCKDLVLLHGPSWRFAAYPAIVPDHKVSYGHPFPSNPKSHTIAEADGSRLPQILPTSSADPRYLNSDNQPFSLSLFIWRFQWIPHFRAPEVVLQKKRS